MPDERPSNETITRWIDAINDEGVNLSKWEIDFMESVTEQWLRRRSLSDAQLEKLEAIYADRTP